MLDLHPIIANFSYMAIFILMIANGAVNFPSSQILYIMCGYFISTGSLLFFPTVFIGALGNTIGNTCIFLLVKKYDKPFARKLLMVNETTFTKIHTALHTTFKNKGVWWLFIGKLTPSVKSFVPIVAGLARTTTSLTAAIFFGASLIWATGVTFLGYFFGENITPTSFTIVSLLVGGTMLFVVYKKVLKNVE
jgi:membrane protein DedA with SNARE-associated domain